MIGAACFPRPRASEAPRLWFLQLTGEFGVDRRETASGLRYGGGVYRPDVNGAPVLAEIALPKAAEDTDRQWPLRSGLEPPYITESGLGGWEGYMDTAAKITNGGESNSGKSGPAEVGLENHRAGEDE